MSKAEKLTLFIVNNWHFCPIPEDIMVRHCDGGGGEHCKDCILDNVHNLRYDKYYCTKK